MTEISESVAVIVVTFERPASVRAVVEALNSSSFRIDHLVVIDNSASALDPPPRLDPPGSTTYEWQTTNIGLSAGIARGFDLLHSESLVMILDDDPIVAGETLRQLVCAVQGGADIASLPTRFTVKMSGKARLFPWSPTLFKRDLINAIGPPMEELFFGYDDWEYAFRASSLNATVTWVDVEVVQQSLGRSWPGRAYLASRNISYLVFRKGLVKGPTTRELLKFLVAAVRPSARSRTRAIREGLVDGVRNKMGPPPAKWSAPKAG